ncbi:MAG: AsmA-like C-terminal region-containing protein [Cyclobacteriaceae bacterium]
MSRLKKIILYSGIGLLVIVIGFAVSLYIFKDRIIQQFIAEANKSLNTPVKIGKIEISTWQDFPNLAIVFTDVYVEDSHPGEFPLLTAKKISFYLNPIEAWKGNYSIRGLQVKDSETNLKINKVGKNNFTIAKPSQGASTSTISFDLKNVKLLSATVSYSDEQANQYHTFISDQLTSSIAIRGDVYKIGADGDVTVQQIGIKDQVFLKEKQMDVVASVDYDDDKKIVSINSASLKINKSLFDVTGTYSFKQKNLIDIKAEGKETDIQTLLALLPDETSKKLRQYQSKGDVFLDLKLTGEISEHKDPFISIHFGCKDATFSHPEYKSKITHANLEGSFASPSLSQFTKAELFLKDVTGELNGKSFSSNLSLQNLEDPYIQFDFKGELDAASLQNFYPIPEIKQIEGNLVADFSIEGKTGLLKKKSTAQQVKTNGTIELQNIQFAYGKKEIHFNGLNGSLQFNNNDLAMSNFRGQFENSDFVLNGFFKNVITFLLFEDQPIGIEADLKSNFLDVDQLFEIGFGESKSDGYKFSISPNVHLNFNCDVKSLKYKRFHPQAIKGNLLVKNQVAVSRNIAMKAMGGDLSLNGIVDAKNTKAIDVVSSFKLNGIYVDSVFYVFENFFQTFIQDKHLKGQAFADVNLEMTLTEDLKLISKTLISDISATIKNGELNNFEPLKALNKYLDDETLNKLRFADLKNDIHIENETIYIPQMEIKSNATTIQLSGTHTFDQQIDYRVVAPLRSKKKIDPDEAFGAIEEDTKGQTKLFLKIKGTTDKYEVGYDREAVKKKIVSDLKKEVKELKEAFQLKGKKKKKELELEKDEYFDWDN